MDLAPGPYPKGVMEDIAPGSCALESNESVPLFLNSLCLLNAIVFSHINNTVYNSMGHLA